MKLLNYVGLLVILTTMGVLFKRYQRKYEMDPELKGDALVKKYLLNDEIIYGKPNLWIHINYEKNNRNWKNFHSRSSMELNKPYMELCIETIIKYNGDSFNIFIINDETFSKLLDDWNIEMDLIPDPIKKNARKVGICKILYKFGGISLPGSFLATQNLKDLYNEGIRNNRMFCVENINDTIKNQHSEFAPDDIIIGCNKYCKKMKEYYEYLNSILKNDYTNESEIKGIGRQWLSMEADDHTINVINGKLIGIKDVDDKLIGIDELFGASHVNFVKNKSGIYIDDEKMSKRVKYNWFNKVAKEDIFKSDLVIGRQMLLSYGQGLI